MKSTSQLKSIRQKKNFRRLNTVHYQGIPLPARHQQNSREHYIYLRTHAEPVSNTKSLNNLNYLQDNLITQNHPDNSTGFNNWSKHMQNLRSGLFVNR